MSEEVVGIGSCSCTALAGRDRSAEARRLLFVYKHLPRNVSVFVLFIAEMFEIL